MADLSDQELIERVGRGDRSAFRLLAQRHTGRAFALAQRMLGNAADAEEIVQEALTRVWVNAARFDSRKASFPTWFYRIVANASLDRLRQRKAPALNIDEPEFQVADPGLDAEAHLILSAREQALKAAVLALPDRQRLALTLCYYEGFLQADAARIMDTHPKALEGLLARAKTALRRTLNEEAS